MKVSEMVEGERKSIFEIVKEVLTEYDIELRENEIPTLKWYCRKYEMEEVLSAKVREFINRGRCGNPLRSVFDADLEEALM